MGEEYAASLQTGAAEEFWTDADVCTAGKAAGCLLQKPGEERCACGIVQTDVQHGLQLKGNIHSQQTAGVVPPQQCAEGAQEGQGSGGHPGGKTRRPAAAKPPDAHIEGQRFVVKNDDIHRGNKKQKQEKYRHIGLQRFDG